MGVLEKFRFLNPYFNDGFVIGNGRLALNESYKNLLLVAPTGMGKTSRFIIPNILQCHGSIVVTDPSGEIYQKTAHFMAHKRGYAVQVFNPTDVERSVLINYLLPFSNSPQKIKQVASILAKNNSSNMDAFWVTQATNIIYILISALVAHADPRFLNIANVRWLLNNFGVEGKAIEQFMLTHLSETMFSEYKAFLQQDTKVLMNSLSTARAALDLWSDPQICQLTSGHTLDFEKFRQQKTILYLVVPEHQVPYFSLIINLTYSAFFNACIENSSQVFGLSGREKLGLPVYFFMDEFANCGEILHFSSIITVSRKHRMPIALVLQDLAQLPALYGKDRPQAIIGGGCANKLFYAGLDIEACQRLEKILGSSTEKEQVESSRSVGRPLLRAAEVRTLKDQHYLLLSSNRKPVQGSAKAYYASFYWRRVTAKRPEPLPRFSQPPLAYLPLHRSHSVSG